jgi:hypothetical protein
MNVARAEASRAKTLGTTRESLVHELNAYTALTVAAAITDLLPGLSAYKTDFSPLLKGQLGDWEKRWFAGGNYGPHASEQKWELETHALMVKDDLNRESREWRKDRWFFPDYSFEYGSLPDYLAVKLLHSPELFRPVTAEEVKQWGEDAVEGKRWALITEADADNFLRARRVDETLQKDILYLKP